MTRAATRCLLLIALGLASPSFAAEPVAYPAIPDNVTFAAVQTLDYKPASAAMTYAADNPALQRGLLWLPAIASATQSAPLVIFIHGGCWLNSFDIAHTYAFSTALAQAGYAVWSLEYRRTGDAGGGWPGTFEDILAGIAFRDNLREFPVDTERFVIAGHSAGGHLALLAGGRIPQAQAVLGLAAITDVVTYARGGNSCQTATQDFLGADPDSGPALYDAANPVAQPLHTNSLLLQGGQDAIVPVAENTLTGVPVTFVPQAGHFDWVHPGTPAFRALLTLLDGILHP